MAVEDNIFRQLQEHLDRQAVGFPPTESGAEVQFLKKLFSPDEARLALHLSYKPTSTEVIVRAAALEFSEEKVERLLDSMLGKVAIGWKEKEGISYWWTLPMVVGMAEQDGRIDPEFQTAADAYMQTKDFGRAFLTALPSQMRTIPVDVSIPVEHPAASYDQIRAIVEAASGPFLVKPCICREKASWQGKPCRMTTRLETCLGFGDAAAKVLRRKHGREITRAEVISILQQNENDGLVLQPSNAQSPAFVCSCCGCCCGMLGVQKLLHRPVDFWTTSFHAAVDETVCKGCGKCVKRCQVNAVSLSASRKMAEVNLDRCIGCGLCVPTCESRAIQLKKNAMETIPPANEEELYDRIMAKRKLV
jgi:Pyruvate/2-oxoacid:ferredoxin oxidoreductase delta subunit